jgi:serine protease inhibitor
MVVDRPFLFAIVHTATGLPLFLGQLSRPGSG